MDVSSVSSSSALIASAQAQSRTRPVEQDQPAQPTQQAQPAQPSQQVQGTREAQQTSSSDERQAQAQAQSEKNRPSVNLNGQTVGTRVNTTA